MINTNLHKGFTLIELMIVVAIIGILASIVYPSYRDSVMRSNRSEGQRELMRIANLEEQFFIDFRTYTATMTDMKLNADPFITEGGYYKIDAVINDAGVNTFTLKATALGAQALGDAECLEFTITDTGAKNATSAGCWEK